MSTQKKILVINPNSSVSVTQGIDKACDALRLDGGPSIDTDTLKEGPPGIETQWHVDSVVTPLVDRIRQKRDDYDAFVIACYSDPGLHACREVARKPVFGIAESALLTAMTLGQRIGVIAILPASISRHLRYAAAMGIAGRLVGERAVGLGVTELADASRTLGRMIETGLALRDTDGADVLIMGCSGMAAYRDRLRDETGLPVVEPSQAAVSMAVGRVMLGW